MRKLSLLLVLLSASFLSQAQSTPDSLELYTGKYVFPAGSVVAETVVSLKDGILSASSDMGTTELKKLEKDVFEVVAYGGTATFKRNAEGKVNAVRIEVSDIVLEGTKSETISYSLQAFNSLQLAYFK